jgi:RNA polymerase sigma factor (sigma-70 family)
MASTARLERPASRSQRPARSKLAHGSLVPLDRSSDERLSRRATQGDQQALGAIFERYQHELYRFCLGLLGEPQDAQDALQNTMVKALRALPGEKREIALRPWLYRIAHNEAIDLRRTRRETQKLDGHLLDGHSSVAETAEHRERLEWLLRDLSDLPERQRTVLVMRELSGLDFADIGAALGTSGAVVRQALYEARRNLEQMDFGRSLRCETVTRVLSDADGRVSGRREIRAHLRDCADCRRFQDRIEVRKETFAGIAPLSGGLGTGILQSALAGGGGSGVGGIGAALGGGGAKSLGTAGALKAVATVATVAVIGTAAVERNSHEHRAASDAAAAPLPQRGHAAHAVFPATRPRSPGQAQPPRRRAPATAAAAVASAPSDAIAQGRVGAGAALHRASPDQTIAPGSESSSAALPGTGESPQSIEARPEPIEATLEPSESPPEVETQSKPAKEGEQEEGIEADAKGEPERPEHPPHPEHSQKPAGAPVEPEEIPQETDATQPPEAEESPESTSHSPNGKAKSHEKQLSH